MRLSSAKLALSFALLTTVASAAHAAWDPVGYYKKRVEDIRQKVASLPADTTRTVVLLGDSLTQGHPAKELAGWTVVNEGISGDRIDVPTSGTGVRLRADLVATARPAHVFLMIGINDLWGARTPAEKTKEPYTGVVETLLKTVPDAKLHLVSLLPTAPPEEGLNAGVNVMNEHIRELARKHSLDYVDLHKEMVGPDGQLRKELTTDGIHLTPAAYQIWTAALEERLRSGE